MASKKSASEEVKTELEQTKKQIIDDTTNKAKEAINKALPDLLDNIQKNINKQQQTP